MRLFIVLNLLVFILVIHSDDIDHHQDSNDIVQEDSISKSSSEISLSSMKCTESGRCGCYKGRCWAYIDDQQMPKTGWWCFTQRDGIRTKQKAWAKCTDSEQCSWTMTCGDCYTYVGKGNQIKTNKLIC
jgi:hypothetical protein